MGEESVHSYNVDTDALRLPIPKPGVYLLYFNDDVVYVGQSVNMFYRLGSHSQRFEFNGVRYFEVANATVRNHLERHFISEYAPIHNTVHVPPGQVLESRLKRTIRYEASVAFDIRRGRRGYPARPDYQPKPLRIPYRLALIRWMSSSERARIIDILGGPEFMNDAKWTLEKDEMELIAGQLNG